MNGTGGANPPAQQLPEADLVGQDGGDAGDGHFEVLWPLARKHAQPLVEVLPVADLSGKVVAELWDKMFQGETVYARLRAQLQVRFPGIRFVPWDRFGDIHGPDERAVIEALADRLRAERVDAAIVGIGA